MRHEKIIKRQDGSKVRINVSFYSDFGRNERKWEFTVDTCEKGKRTWVPPFDINNYNFRGKTQSEKQQLIEQESLRRASQEEIDDAIIELWNQLLPDGFSVKIRNAG